MNHYFEQKFVRKIFTHVFCFLSIPEKLVFLRIWWSDEPKQLNFAKSLIKTEVCWDLNGTEITKSIEKLSLNTKNNKTLEKDAFIFTGSKKSKELTWLR